jgi:anti-sigma B factor antagonist
MPPIQTEQRDEAQFQTHIERLADSTYVVSVIGEIDLFTGPRFETALLGALDGGAVELVIDLSECGFMDSTGIRILLSVNEQLDRSRRPMAVVTGHPNVRQVLELTGVDTIVGLHASRSAALNGADGD